MGAEEAQGAGGPAGHAAREFMMARRRATEDLRDLGSAALGGDDRWVLQGLSQDAGLYDGDGSSGQFKLAPYTADRLTAAAGRRGPYAAPTGELYSEAPVEVETTPHASSSRFPYHNRYFIPQTRAGGPAVGALPGAAAVAAHAPEGGEDGAGAGGAPWGAPRRAGARGPQRAVDGRHGLRREAEALGRAERRAGAGGRRAAPGPGRARQVR